MNPAETILAEIGAGPATVTLESDDEYEIEFREVDIDGSEFHAEGVGQDDPDLRYRIDHPAHSDDPLVLKRRHTGESDWTELGTVAFASQES